MRGVISIIPVDVETKLDLDCPVLPAKHHYSPGRSSALALSRVKAHVRPHGTGPARARWNVKHAAARSVLAPVRSASRRDAVDPISAGTRVLYPRRSGVLDPLHNLTQGVHLCRS